MVETGSENVEDVDEVVGYLSSELVVVACEGVTVGDGSVGF